MKKVNNYLTEDDVVRLSHDFGIVFDAEIEVKDSQKNKKIAEISDFITKITASENW